MFRNRTMQRGVAALVLTAFTSLSLYPLTAAAQARAALEKAGMLPQLRDEGVIGNAKRYFQKLAGEQHTTAAGREPGTDERFAQLLNDIHEDLKAAVPKEARRYAGASRADGGKDGMDTRAIGPEVRIEVERNQAAALQPLPGTDIGARIQRIRDKAAELQRLYPEIEQGFQDSEAHLRSAKLPPEILDRHREALAQYTSRKAEFERLTGRLAQAGSDSERQSALAALGAFMAKYPNAKPHQYTDPTKLPFRTPDGKVRKPFETSEQYQANLFPPQYEKLMLASLSLDGVQLAQATLPPTPAEQDLAETEEVQITQAIRDQAKALDNHPVQIYNWVRNNIQFIPSYGSIQGSDLTLQNKRGNAFDTASLLIALYRAAGIPARYVYGTIEVPANKVMNWVGGVSKAEAAQSLLGQGGIPNVALVSGGTVKAFRMEHVWVEAYVDYVPSRGAKNLTPDTWVPLDASFKQYRFTQGMDIKSKVPLDSQSLLDQIRQGATINEAEGWVQNLNQASLQSQLAVYQDQVKAYIDSQKAGATVGDVLGTQKIIEQNHTILLGSLPYRTVATGNRFQALPDRLKWKFKTNIYAGGWYGDSGSPYIEINQSTAKLAGRKITLSFIPATQADQDLINSYLPKPHADGTPIDPNELPTSLPGYLLKMKAEFRIDGQVVAQTTENFTMGSDVKQSNQYFNPATGTWDGGNDNDITVGEYNAIGLDLQGITTQHLKSLQEKVAATSAKIIQNQQNPVDPSPIENLTNDDVTGDFVYSGILAYFTKVDDQNQLTARISSNVVSYRLPSYGRFVEDAQPKYWFGIPKLVVFRTVSMDVDYLYLQVEAKDANSNTRTNFVRNIGFASSSAEHEIPEKLFSNPNIAPIDIAQPQGISAVKALTIAAAQGQRIFHLNTVNQASHSAILAQVNIDSTLRTEIANALYAGKEVTLHQNPITLNGWNGSGYIVLDPNTGAGAYKISGGANGGALAVAAGALNGFADALLKKLRNPDHVNGPRDELSRSRILHKLAMVANLISFIDALKQILENDNLSATQKTLQIIMTLSFTVAAMEGVGALAVFFGNPVGAAVAGVLLAMILAYFLFVINDLIVQSDI